MPGGDHQGSFVLKTGHIGLGSLLARFDAMGGAMRIDSAPGSGTRITAVSPPEPLVDA